MKNKLYFPLLLVLAGSILTGCAVGNRYDYQSTNVALPVTGSGDLALGVIDQRPYVQNGDKKPNFIGLQRGGFGNPFDVTTASGESLTNEMSVALARSLKEHGFSVNDLRFSAPDAAIVANAISGKNLDKAVVITVREWKTDVFTSITLHYDLALQVIDKQATVLAENQLKGTDKIGGAGFEGKNSATAATAFERKIGQLFNHDKVKEALNNG